MFSYSANLSLLFNEVPLLKRFGLAQAVGFRFVEIQFPYECGVHEIKQQLAQHHLQLDLINLPVGDLMQGGDGLVSHPNKKVQFRQALNQGLYYASELNVKKVNILSGRQPLNINGTASWQTLVENVKLACEALDAVGIMPLVEVINPITMPRFWLHHLTMFDQLKRDVDHPALRLQFDIYHMAMLKEPIIPRFKQYLPHIGHIQFADYPNRHEPGTGELNFKEIFTAISHHYHDVIGAEYIPLNSTVQSLQWFRQI